MVYQKFSKILDYSTKKVYNKHNNLLQGGFVMSKKERTPKIKNKITITIYDNSEVEVVCDPQMILSDRIIVLTQVLNEDIKKYNAFKSTDDNRNLPS